MLESMANSTIIHCSALTFHRINSSEPDFGVTCMHGAGECAGNVQQLCAAKYAPSQFWQFVQCQNYQGRASIGDPEVALKCSAVVGIDWVSGPVGQCAGVDGSGKGKEGVQLLQESVQITEQLGVRYVVKYPDLRCC